MNLVAMQGLIQQDFYNEDRLRETMGFIKMMLTDITYAEKELMDSYKEALQMLENNGS